MINLLPIRQYKIGIDSNVTERAIPPHTMGRKAGYACHKIKGDKPMHNCIVMIFSANKIRSYFEK